MENNKEFTWTDELVHACCIHIRHKFKNPNDYTDKWEGVTEEMEKFKQSKVKELSDKIEVGKMSCVEGEDGYGKMKWNLQFKTNKHIHYDKAVELCNLLEKYLNGESVVNGKEEGKLDLTENELKEMMCNLMDGDYIHTIRSRSTMVDYVYDYIERWFRLREEKRQDETTPQPTPTSLGKDWEVISFKVNIGDKNFDGMLLTKTDGYFGVKDFNVTEEDLLKSKIHLIHSVKRKSDGEVFTVGDFIKVKKDSLRKGWSDPIVSFEVVGKDMIATFGTWRQPLNDIERMHKNIHVTEAPTPEPKHNEAVEPILNVKGCGMCGGKLVLIRGKNPGEDKREVCATCATERLEQINAISSRDYGKAYTSN